MVCLIVNWIPAWRCSGEAAVHLLPLGAHRLAAPHLWRFLLTYVLSFSVVAASLFSFRVMGQSYFPPNIDFLVFWSVSAILPLLARLSAQRGGGGRVPDRHACPPLTHHRPGQARLGHALDMTISRVAYPIISCLSSASFHRQV
ncbi:hypothetical protein E2C01_052999 [Portunus trituberculatus]|uniref:Uncharacterized protein n=1 Tax=Portunus trituberculatus TaxID=210409 RepID=A0A5B7GQU5_PORTR|nr:hypothetical protein [Portunus trituberculatus]